MTPFNENALKLAPWSATKWKTATGCPFRAYHAWVVKAKEEWDVLPDDSPMIIGIKMHTFMELVLGKFPKDVFPILILGRTSLFCLQRIEPGFVVNAREYPFSPSKP